MQRAVPLVACHAAITVRGKLYYWSQAILSPSWLQTASADSEGKGVGKSGELGQAGNQACGKSKGAEDFEQSAAVGTQWQAESKYMVSLVH